MPNIRHSSAVKPISIPVLADVNTDNWDRVQTISPAYSQPGTNQYEIGREDKMARRKDTFEATLSIGQFEYGAIDSFLQVAGLSAEPASGLQLSDFSSSRLDFYQPGKDEYGGSIEQTLWLEKMSLESFNLSMNAEEIIERSFDFSGEFSKILQDTQKYLIFKEDDAASGVSGNYDIVLSDPAPVVDPNNAGVYIMRVTRVRSGVATELTTTDYTWDNPSTTLTIVSGLAGDNYRIWYTAASYGTSGDPSSLNDADDYFIGAENVTVTIDDGTNPAVELTKLTSLSIDASLNRISEGVIGSTEKVLKDVESYEVSCSLDGFVKEATILEALATQAGQSYGIIDMTDLSSVTVTVKIYQESAKSTFLIGYQMSGLEFDSGSQSWEANAFASEPVSLQGDSLLITADSGNL